MEIGKGKVIEPLKTEEPLRILARPDNMVQIPLSEYKRYIEDTIKDPTVEIPLSEYMSLREEVGNLRITVERLDRENMEMRSKERVNREVTNIVENAEKRILEEIKKVTESDTLRKTEV